MEKQLIDSYSSDDRRALKLFTVLSRAAGSAAHHARQDILEHGLSVSEFGVLELLWHKGPQPLGEIAERILLTSGSVTYVIDQLVTARLVDRRPCPNDRRVTYAALTSEGEKRIAAIFPRHIERIKKALSGLSADEQHTAILLLKKLGLAAKSQETGSASPTPTESHS